MPGESFHRWRKAEERKLAKLLRAKDRERLRDMRAAIRTARLERRDAVRAIVVACRAARVQLRERARELRRQALAELRQAQRIERKAQREACSVRAAKTRAEHGEQLTARQRVYQAEQNRIAAERAFAKHERKRGQSRATARERAQEADEDVERNLPSDLVDVWHAVKRTIRATPHKSRTEGFLEWVEQTPEAVWEIRERVAERKLAQLIREEHELHRASRKASRYKRTPQALAAALAEVPF